MNVQTSIPAPVNLAAIKSRQQAAWGSGDYAVIGTTLQIVGEMLCEAVDLRSDQRPPHSAAGGPVGRRSRHRLEPGVHLTASAVGRRRHGA